MSFFDSLKKEKGGYLFLSHSHADIEKVREIRNQLEQQGFEPLCFYLKCLDDDSEIEDLIKREIDAREWFVFINSENSRKSKWVTLEREYITRTNNKKILTLDIDDDNAIYETIQKITHNLRVFISYSAKDAALARKVKDELEKKDYLVFNSDSLPLDSNYDTTIANEIIDASKEGCVITLLTPNFFDSKFAQEELVFARSIGGNIIPIIVGDTNLDIRFKLLLATTPKYHLPQNPTNTQIEEMIDKIGRAITK